MIIYIGADHKGFNLKEQIKKYLDQSGYSVLDMGNASKDESDNYPAFAKAVVHEVQGDTANRRGILMCGSGAGMCITANKFAGIRASIAFSPDHASAIKQEDDVNVLCLAADYLEPEQAKKIIAIWMQTSFDEEQRHKDRLEQIRQMEVELGLWK